MIKIKKLNNIEFLRVIFIIILVYCHLPLLTSVFPNIPMYKFISDNAKFSMLVVDFFFILSGFFLRYTTDFKQDTFDFIKKRMKRLWSVVAFGIVCYIALSFFNITSYGKNIYDYIYAFFFLDNIGVTLHHVGPSWYVSVLLLVSLFYFYLYKALPEKIANLIIGFLVWLAYVFTINADGGFIQQHIRIENNIFCMGLLRGIGGIGLGIFLYYVYEHYKDKIPNQNKLVYTFLEIGVLSWSIYALISAPSDIHNSMIFIIAFLILIWLFLIKKGYFSQLTDKNIFCKLAKYNYSIFLTHLIIFYLLRGNIWNNSNLFIPNHPIVTLILLYSSVFIFGIFAYHFIEKPQNKCYEKLGFIKYYLTIFTIILITSFSISLILTHRPIKLDKTYNFNRDRIYIKTNGVANPEHWGRWTIEEKVDIIFYSPVKKDLEVTFNVNPFLPEKMENQRIDVYSRGEKLATWNYRLENPFPNTTIVVKKELIKNNGKVNLEFLIKSPISPKELGLSDDNRKLGLGFKSVTIREVK